MQQLSQEQGNCCRLALLACQQDVKCHTANRLLFRKDDFCTTFLIGNWLADIHIVDQMAHSFHRK